MRNPDKFNWPDFIRKVAVIAVPVALQNLLSTTGSMIDTVMLASLGETTVGAVGLCAQLSSLMFSCYWGFVGGGMMFFSQYWGAQDDDGINRSYGITLTFMMTVAAIFSTLAVLFPEFAMGIYTDKPTIQAIGVRYLRIVGFSYPLQILAMAMCALLRSIERVKLPMFAGFAAMVTNCCTNYLLIFGKFGFPKLGVAGAAVGTVLAGLVNVLVIVIYVAVKKVPYLLWIRHHFRWKLRDLKAYLAKCFPILCNELFLGIGGMLMNIVLGRQPEEAIAALAVFRTLEGLVIAFFAGFSNAATVLVGKEVGAGNLRTAWRRMSRIVYLCSGVIAVVLIVLNLVHRPLLTVMGLSGESFRLASRMLLIYGVFAVIRMGNWAKNDSFRAAGDPAFGSIMEISFMFAVLIPAMYIANFAFHAPFLVVFSCCFIDEPIRAVIMERHMYSGKCIKPVSEIGKAALPEFQAWLRTRKHKQTN